MADADDHTDTRPNEDNHAPSTHTDDGTTARTPEADGHKGTVQERDQARVR